VDAAKATLLDRTSKQLNGGVQAILLDHEQLDVVCIAGLDQRICIGQRDCHRLLDYDMLSRPRRDDSMCRVKS
jgi:hypothetical protein